MKKNSLFFVLLIAQHFSFAKQKVISLYHNAAPGTKSWNWAESINDTNDWNTKVVYYVTQTSLTVFQPEAGKANGSAVVICPG